MQRQLLVVRRYRKLHRVWRRLQRVTPKMSDMLKRDRSWKLASVESEVRALGWVLGVDPDHEAVKGNAGTAPRYLGAEMSSPDGNPALRGVRLTRAWREPRNGKWYWLLEVPAAPDGDTEYWAAFLPEQCVAELALAIGAALTRCDDEAIDRMLDEDQQADAPTVSDLRTLIQTVEWSVLDRQTGGAA